MKEQPRREATYLDLYFAISRDNTVPKTIKGLCKQLEECGLNCDGVKTMAYAHLFNWEREGLVRSTPARAPESNGSQLMLAIQREYVRLSNELPSEFTRKSLQTELFPNGVVI